MVSGRTQGLLGSITPKTGLQLRLVVVASSADPRWLCSRRTRFIAENVGRCGRGAGANAMANGVQRRRMVRLPWSSP
ncbi:hypothetical protein NL676_017115 [Syzygium grande]|nr:hypothetical protein NL676_017115 [Syzygium grande]